MKDIPFESHLFEKKERPEAPMIPEQNNGTSGAPALSTFHTDIATLVEKRGITKTQVVLAEIARRDKQGGVQSAEGEKPTRLGHIIFLLALVLAFGIGVGVYALIGVTIPIPFLSEKKQADEQQPDKTVEAVIAINHSSRLEVLINIRDIFEKTNLATGDVRIITFITRDERDHTENEVTADALLSLLGTKPPPQDLLRSLDATITYGIHSNGKLVGYIKLRSRFHPETFAGMLAWEPRMAEDLITVFDPEVKQSAITALRGRSFKDEQIAGTPARVLSDPDGVSLLAYAFPDQKTLFIAGGKETLRILLEAMHTDDKE